MEVGRRFVLGGLAAAAAGRFEATLPPIPEHIKILAKELLNSNSINPSVVESLVKLAPNHAGIKDGLVEIFCENISGKIGHLGQLFSLSPISRRCSFDQFAQGLGTTGKELLENNSRVRSTFISF
jgi:hypothetical protein